MKDITVQSTITILQAMKILDITAEKCLLIVNENNKLLSKGVSNLINTGKKIPSFN